MKFMCGIFLRILTGIIRLCGGEGENIGQAIYGCYDVGIDAPGSFGAGKWYYVSKIFNILI